MVRANSSASEAIDIPGAGIQPGASQPFEADYLDPPFGASSMQVEFATGQADAAGKIVIGSDPAAGPQAK